MKIFGKCIGCKKRKLLNLMRLCKKCNKEAHKYVSKEEIARIKAEAATLSDSKAAKAEQKAKADEDKAKEQSGEGDEGEDKEDSDKD